MPSIDALDYPELALDRSFELHDRGLVGGTVMGGERLFEAGELDDDGAFVDAGVEGLDPTDARQELAAAGLDRQPHGLGVFRQRVGILDLPVTNHPVNHLPGRSWSARAPEPSTIDLPPDLPRVMADRQRVEQVLNNLLANAARQAPESSPIPVAAERDGVHVAVSVADEGRGIPPERLAQLFRKYSGAAGGETGAGTGGSGLGLAICTGLVEAHGGRIWAESGGPGLGARFTFTLPVAGQAGAGAPDPAPDRPAPRQGREPDGILVVDDDPQTLRHVRDTLAEAGYSPLVTGDPGELGQIIRTEKPALVLLDLMLPGTDGIELMQNVPELAELPVIFISGYGRDETIARALEAGAADYIVKPFSPTELTARIRAALRRRADPEPFVLGDLAIDYDRRLVTMAGREVELTATEYELLRALALNAGRVTTSETLLDRVWAGRGNGDTKVVRAFVKQLRQKLGDDAANPAWIFNVRGVGYRMPRPGAPGEP